MAGDDEILRIAAQFDVGSITAGMDEAAATVNAGTSKMNDSFSSLAAAQIRVASANKDLRDTLNATVSKGLSPTVAATEEVASAMYEAKVATDAFKNAQAEAYGATERMTGGVNNARVAFTGLTQDLGIRGSRALGSFLSQSEAIAPILQAAFPVVAALAFFEVLEAGYTKIIEVTSALAGWTKEAKHMQEVLIELNQQQVVFNEHLAIEKLSLADVGLKGAALDAQKYADVLKEKKIVQDAYNESFQREKNIQSELDGMRKATSLVPPVRALQEFFPSMNTIGEGDKIAQLNKELDEAMKRTNELGNQLKTLDQVTIPKGSAETTSKAREEAEKYAQTLARLADEDEARTQRDAEKELRDLEKVMNERERMEEELEKTTLDLAKKDLESFQHDIIEKTRLQEQFGKEQLEQIKSQDATESKSVKTNSPVGGADPRLIQIADQALDQQAFKIMDLIALEEQLRTTLLQTGLAESDPKIQESLGRQQQLVQQLNVDMQAYGKTVNEVNQAQVRAVMQGFSQMNSVVNSSLTSWIDGQQSFGRAMQKVWTDLVNTAFNAILKIGEHWIESIVARKAQETIFGSQLLAMWTGQSAAYAAQQAAQTATTASNVVARTTAQTTGDAVQAASALVSAQEKAINTSATDVGEVISYAATGAAGAAAAAAPMGPEQMLSAAATAEAIILSFLPQAGVAFEKGGIMPNYTGLALLHPREMVLPSHISESVQRMASGGGGGSRGGGAIHIHQTISGSPSASDMANMEKATISAVRRARRKGAF